MSNTPVPPQNLEAEESILGAIMLAPGVIERVGELVADRDFARPSHGKIYAAALHLYVEGEPITPVTLQEQLTRRGELDEAGGSKRLFELASLVPASANAPHYAKIVHELAEVRRLIAAGQEIARAAWAREGTAREISERAQELIFDMATEGPTDLHPVGDGIRADYDKLIALHESGRDVIGLPTGFDRLDRMTAGLQPGNLIVLAARPSMGKTALALGFASNAVLRADTPAALFTLEMNESEVRHRLIALEAFVDLHKLRTGRLDPEEWSRVTRAVARIEPAELYIDAGDITMVELRARARRLKLRKPELGLVIVDYLQLMSSGREAEGRVQEIGQISRSLKLLAGELDVPVVALSQLSRQVEQRHDKRPLLSDLRESGSIEQDADIVAFCYREEYYNPEDVDVAGLAELIIAKHRNGPTGTAKLTFVKRYARFSDPPLPGTGAAVDEPEPVQTLA